MLPELVDNDRVLLYTARRSGAVWGDEEVVAQVLATNERTVILRKATDARYLPTGHLVFMRQGVLWAVRFDPSRRAVQGEPVALHEGIAQALVGDSDRRPHRRRPVQRLSCRDAGLHSGRGADSIQATRW